VVAADSQGVALAAAVPAAVAGAAAIPAVAIPAVAIPAVAIPAVVATGRGHHLVAESEGGVRVSWTSRQRIHGLSN
jgi:hypothetical protein